MDTKKVVFLMDGTTVRVARNLSASIPDPHGTWAPILHENINNPFATAIKAELQEQSLKSDLIVLAMGLHPGRAFYEACVSVQIAPEVVILGDAFQIGGVFEAVKSGKLAGRNL